MSCLKPCPSCGRHIRSTEATCPFCGAGTPEGFEVCAAKGGSGAVAATRAAVVFAGALTLAGCPGISGSGSGSGSASGGTAVPEESAQPGRGAGAGGSAGGQPSAQPTAQPTAQPGRAPVNVVPPYSVAPVEKVAPEGEAAKTRTPGGDK